MKPLETTEYVDSKLVLDAAKEYLGIRYVHAARTKYGCDCVGLYFLVLQNLGHPMADYFKDYKTYTRYAQGEQLEKELLAHMVEVPIEDRQTGDLLLFYTGKAIHHVAIYEKLDTPQRKDEMIIHSDIRRGVVYMGLGYRRKDIGYVLRLPVEKSYRELRREYV